MADDYSQRYFMHLAYRGAPFHGWQEQPDAVSVQSVLEGALSTIAREPVKIVGAGRTDAGVNARMMVAHFDLHRPVADLASMVRGLNTLVGRDIAVYSITSVHPDAHARFDATRRTYHYYTSARKSPFFYPLTWLESRNLDFDAMNRAASLLLETEDFTSFSKLHTDVKTNICHVSYARWHSTPVGHVFVISADRFLRNMVRAVVGTLVDVGRGKTGLEDFRRIIEAKDRCSAGTSMPPEALYLWNVEYDYWKPDNIGVSGDSRFFDF